MVKRLSKIIINLLIITITIFCLWGISENIDLNKTWATVDSLNIGIVALTVLATISAYTLRTFRWMLLLNHQQKPTTFLIAFSSLMYGYLINLGIPRLGEISRAGAISKQNKKSFPFTLGTILIERLIDVSTLALLLLLYSLMFSNILSAFFEEQIASKLHALPNISHWLWFPSLLIIALMSNWLIKKYSNKIKKQFIAFKNGILTAKEIPNKTLFGLLTLGIWLSYFLTSYLCFFSFNHQYNLGFTAGISVLILGSVARSIPIQGGSIGVFHTTITAVLTLSIFGVDKQTAFTISFVIHAIQTVFQILAGLVSFAFLTISSAKRTTT